MSNEDETDSSKLDWELTPFEFEPFDLFATFVAERRRRLADSSTAESVRHEYALVCEDLRRALSLERALREQVLSDDEPTINLRLRSVLLLYATVGRENSKLRFPTPDSLADDPEIEGITDERRAALRVTLSRLKPDLYFAILASYRYWLSDSHSRFLGEAADEYRDALEVAGVISEGEDNSQAFDIIDAVVASLNSHNCSLADLKVNQWLK